MEGELVKVSSHDAPLEIPSELKKLYMETYFKGLTENDALIAYRDAERRGLSIEAKQIHFIPRWDSKLNKNVPTAQTSIDGFRLIAARTGRYGGSINAKLTVRMKSGEKAVIQHEEYDPAEVSEIISGTISVINKEFEQPQTATALFKGYCQTFKDGNPMGLWEKMPDVMILKCAESLALRKAFPQDLSGLYTNEEMGQANNDIHRTVYSAPVTKTVDVKPVVKPNPVEVKATDPPTIDVVGEPPVPVEAKKPKKQMSIVEIVTKIPDALKRRKADIDPELFPFCEQLVLQHFEVEKAEDIPEDKREEVLNFLKNDLIAHLKEHGEL